MMKILLLLLLRLPLLLFFSPSPEEIKTSMEEDSLSLDKLFLACGDGAKLSSASASAPEFLSAGLQAYPGFSASKETEERQPRRDEKRRRERSSSGQLEGRPRREAKTQHEGQLTAYKPNGSPSLRLSGTSEKRKREMR